MIRENTIVDGHIVFYLHLQHRKLFGFIKTIASLLFSHLSFWLVCRLRHSGWVIIRCSDFQECQCSLLGNYILWSKFVTNQLKLAGGWGLNNSNQDRIITLREVLKSSQPHRRRPSKKKNSHVRSLGQILVSTIS